MSATAVPRLAPLALGGWSPGSIDLLRGRVALADRYLSDEPDAPPMPAILGLLAHHPSLAANWLALSGGLLDEPVLEPRDRELLVLRVAWRTQSRYEWAQHVRLAAETGLTPTEIAAVPSNDLSGWPARDRCLLGTVDQMIDDHRVDDRTWQELAGHFSEQQLLELLFVVGTYLCLAVVLNSVDLQPDVGTADGRAELPGPEGSR